MSLLYLPEHAENALLALELAHKEIAHLRYSQALLTAREATEMLFHTVNAIEAKAAEIGLRNAP